MSFSQGILELFLSVCLFVLIPLQIIFILSVLASEFQKYLARLHIPCLNVQIQSLKFNIFHSILSFIVLRCYINVNSGKIISIIVKEHYKS